MPAEGHDRTEPNMGRLLALTGDPRAAAASSLSFARVRRKDALAAPFAPPCSAWIGDGGEVCLAEEQP